MNTTVDAEGCDVVLSGEEAVLYLYSVYKKVIILGFVPVVTAVGHCTNIAFLYVVHRIQSMRTLTNFYLSILAISDASLLIVGSMQYLVTYFKTPVDYGLSFTTEYGCVLSNFVIYFCYFASVFIITLVSIERYLAICHPVRHHIIKGKSWALKQTISVWLMSLLLACLGLDYHGIDNVCVGWPDQDAFNDWSSPFPICKLVKRCSWCWDALHVVDFVQFVIASVLSVYLYSNIIYKLSVRANKDVSQTRTETVFRDRKRVAKMLILNGMVFFLCLAPFQLINLNHLCKLLTDITLFTDEERKYILWGGRVSMLLNSAINPVLYSISNKRYRKAFLKTFGCRVAGRMQNITSVNHTNIVLSVSRTIPTNIRRHIKTTNGKYE